jgi:hypothetical protein
MLNEADAPDRSESRLPEEKLKKLQPGKSAMGTAELADDLDQALLAANDQTSRDLIAAWLRWRGLRRLVPMRSAVELEDIKGLLGRVVLFELINEDEIRIKVAGSQLRDHANFEATGRNLADITLPGQWPVRYWRFNEMAVRPCGGVMINHDNQTRSGAGVTFETVILPIEPVEAGKPRLLIGNVAVLGGVFEPPAQDRPQFVRLAKKFRFLDIGAGIPDRIQP